MTEYSKWGQSADNWGEVADAYRRSSALWGENGWQAWFLMTVPVTLIFGHIDQELIFVGAMVGVAISCACAHFIGFRSARRASKHAAELKRLAMEWDVKNGTVL